MPEGFDLPFGEWLAVLRLVAALIGGYLLVLWFASILWVYRDIRSRTNDPVSQLVGVAIAVVFPILGLPIYFVLRPSETLQEAYDRQLEQEAILSDLHSISACPDCRRPVTDEFMVCAYCGTQLRQPCANCSHLLQFAWRYCPFCAAPQPRRQAARASADGAPAPATRAAEAAPRPERSTSEESAQRRRPAEAETAEARAATRTRTQVDERPASQQP